MKFLVIVQDLRIVGTSAGIGRRSLLAKLGKLYPNALIDVLYIINEDTDDHLDLLPVNAIEKQIVNTKIPFLVAFINRFYWRLFNVSLNERYIHKQFAKFIAKIDHHNYDHVLITSCGIEHETILATYNLPILRNAILVFHDPYPLAWYVGGNRTPSNLDLFRLKRVMQVVAQAKTCCTTAKYMSQDLQHLYASTKKFYTLPHQFDISVFNVADASKVVKKSKKISISYQGALMFGRNVDNLLIAYESLINENAIYKTQSELILRIKGDRVKQVKERFKDIDNIQILNTLDFSNSFNEQVYERDIVIILENGPLYCNILVGKASFLAAYHKPVLCLSPDKSELRTIITDERCIANMHDVLEIKAKLKGLIDNRLISNEPFYPFGDYFSDERFKESMETILNNS